MPPHLSRYFRIVRAQRGRCGASSHDHDRIDGRDDVGFLDDDLNRVVSVLLASIIDILPHDNSVFYSPPDVQTRPSANNGIVDREHRRKITTNYECDWPAVSAFIKTDRNRKFTVTVCRMKTCLYLTLICYLRTIKNMARGCRASTRKQQRKTHSDGRCLRDRRDPLRVLTDPRRTRTRHSDA